MKAIILAAGAGRRLGLAGPKCLAEVGGMSILHRQLAALRAGGIGDFIVVVGHQQEQVRRHLADQPGRFTFIVNERFGETNTIYSLYLAREHIAGGFYYANADVVFDRRLIARLRAAPEASALAVQVKPCGEEEVKVIVRDEKEGGNRLPDRPEGCLAQKVFDPFSVRIMRIGKKLDPAQCLGEFVGVARFGGELGEAFGQALLDLVEKQGVRTDYFERAVDILCDKWTLIPVDVSDLPCIEVDFPADLEKARRQIAPHLVT